MMALFSRPVLSLSLAIEGCAYEVYFNGGLVTCDLGGGSAREEQPINHLARSGVNDVEVWLYKNAPHEDSSVAKVELTVNDASTLDAQARSLFTLSHSATVLRAGGPAATGSPAGRFDSARNLQSSDRGDVLVGPALGAAMAPPNDNIFVLKRTIELPMPLPAWAFLSGERLPQWFETSSEELDGIHDGLLAAYQRLRDSLVRRDVAGFLRACELRSREIDAAYYQTPGTTEARLRTVIQDSLANPDMTLAPVTPPGQWQYTLGSRGQLVALTDGEYASPILRFQHGEPGLARIFPVTFMRRDGKYIVAR